MTYFLRDHAAHLAKLSHVDLGKHAEKLSAEIESMAPAERMGGVPEGADGDVFHLSGNAWRMTAAVISELAWRANFLRRYEDDPNRIRTV